MLEYLLTHKLELAATVTGLVCVWLNARESVWGWVWGLASVGMYAWIFWEARLYADAGLQLVFAASSVYGIWLWSRGGTAREQHPVSYGSVKEWLVLGMLTVGSTTGLGWFLATQTPDPRPWLDAALTAASLAAQYQLARKRIENWLVWIAVDAIYVFLYLDQALYWTTFLYAAYLGIAAWGYWGWKRVFTSATAGTRSSTGTS